MIKEQNKFSQTLKKQSRSANGRWTKTEHERFMKGLQRYGRDWVSVQKIVKSRTLTQVRSHAQKVFLKLTQQDIQALIVNQSQHEVSNADSKSNSGMETVQKIELSESINTQQIKPASKSQIDLVDIFMKAIENQEKQQVSQQQHTTFPDMQTSQKQQQILKQGDQKRNYQKTSPLVGNKQNINETKNESNGHELLYDTYQYRIIPIQIDIGSRGGQK